MSKSLINGCGRNIMTTPTRLNNMAARELITIQCGHYSNFIGTHWWNLQDVGLWSPLISKEEKSEVNYDCTFREGITLSGKETYTPRLIAIDCPGSLDSLKLDGCLYDLPSKDITSPTTWGGPLEKHHSEIQDKNEYLQDLEKLDEGNIEEQDINSKNYQLESMVRVWSDFLRPHLHPQSLLTIPGFHHNDERFDVWPSGLEVWKKKEFQVAFEDRLHTFSEECDYLQGFQVIFDLHQGGFSSIAATLSQYLYDEFSSKSQFSVATMPTHISGNTTKQNLLYYTLNCALAITELYETSSLLLPLSLDSCLWPVPTNSLTHPLLLYDCNLPYHTSAILASILESCTSIYRSPRETMSDVCGLMCNRGRKMCSLSFNFPLDLLQSDDLSAFLTSNSLVNSLYSLTPHCITSSDLWSQSICIRGNRHEKVSVDGHKISDPLSILTHHLYQTHPSTNSQLSIFRKPLFTNTPYPHIFNLPQHPVSTPCCTALQSHSGLRSFVGVLYDHTLKCNPRLVPTYATSCLDCDSYQEMLISLTNISDCYHTGGPQSECSTDEEN